MTQYVFMNEELKKAKPKRPVIVNQKWDGSQRESNAFKIKFGGRYIGLVRFDPDLLPACDTHDVKAWVEFLDEVELVPVQMVTLTPEQEAMLEAEFPQAHAKEPNKPVVLDKQADLFD